MCVTRQPTQGEGGEEGTEVSYRPPQLTRDGGLPGVVAAPPCMQQQHTPAHVRALRATFIILLGFVVYKYVVQHTGQGDDDTISA